MRSQPDNSVIKDSLEYYLNIVELNVVEHHILRAIAKNSHAKHLHCVQLNCQDLQYLTENDYSIEAIEAALSTLHARNIIVRWEDDILGPNLFLWEWVLCTNDQQQTEQSGDEQGDRQSLQTLPQQPVTKPIIH